MQQLSARDMLDWTEDEVWELDPSERCDLVFDDTTLEDVSVVDVQISWYFWRVSHTYSAVPVTSNLFLHGRPFTDGLARQMMNDIVQSTKQFPHIEREDVWEIIYRHVYNRSFVAMATRLLPYISDTNGDDIVELLDDEQIAEANASVNGSGGSVDNAYDVIESVFMSDKYNHNPIVRPVKYGTLNIKQMLPSFGPRGRTTGIDSVIHLKYIVRGFAMGFTSIAEFAKESRSAAKALLFNKDPVADAEYFSRRLQFVAGYVRRLIRSDCKTKDYHTIHIPEGKEGEVLIEAMDGLTCVHANGHSPFDGSDKSQLGKVVKIRTAMTCRYQVDQAVCQTCYGSLSDSIPDGDCPGHVSCTSINERLTQLIISTKHLDFIIHSMLVVLSRDERYFFTTKPGRSDMVYYNPDRRGDKIQFRISKKEAPKLTSVRYVKDTSMMNPSITSQLLNIDVDIVDNNGELLSSRDLNMVKRSTKASMSREFLAYIKRVGWEESERSYVIDMSKWTEDAPLFVYPHKHENMSEYGKRVERFIRSTRVTGDDDDKHKKKGNVNMLTKYADVDAALYDAFYLISGKISGVYLGHVATILAASRAADVASGDYSLPGGSEYGQFVKHDDLIRYRSLSVAMLFERQVSFFNDIDSFIIKDRLHSTLDDLIYLEEDKYPRT